MLTDAQIRNDARLLGRDAYEASLRAAPRYHDGSARKTWDQLGEVERWSWSRPLRPDPAPEGEKHHVEN